MSQNLWATIMPFGPVTNILLAQKKKFCTSLWLALIIGTATGSRQEDLANCNQTLVE
jgi:hypothetical protein